MRTSSNVQRWEKLHEKNSERLKESEREYLNIVVVTSQDGVLVERTIRSDAGVSIRGDESVCFVMLLTFDASQGSRLRRLDES